MATVAAGFSSMIQLARSGDDAFRDVASARTHHGGHHRAERFLAAYRSFRPQFCMPSNRLDFFAFRRISHQHQALRFGIFVAGEMFACCGGNNMEYEAERNTKAQLIALMMTIAVVGGAIIYAM
jgi:hypothetical protein